MSFSSFGLRAELLQSIAQEGYTEPTPVQQRAIPLVLEGADIMAAAQTGTGKTAAFALPILHRLSQTRASERRVRVRALVLTPTRELAAQVAQSFTDYGRHLHLKTGLVFGGVAMVPQIEMLRRGVDVLVATPGRLLDHAGHGAVDLGSVEILVLDEADRMLDMGFVRDIRRILALLPPLRQNLLFSATFPPDVRMLAREMMRNPVTVDVERPTLEAPVEQIVHPVDRARKRAVLAHLLKTRDWAAVLVFVRTKHQADRLADALAREGIPAAAIHGDKSQNARTRALSEFKAGKVRVLVATDLASRGLDIAQLPCVVNYEMPSSPEDYVHRIGRTGRAGRPGLAISLVAIEEHAALRDVERLLRHELPLAELPGFEPSVPLTLRGPARAGSATTAEVSESAIAPASAAGQAESGFRPHPVRRPASRPRSFSPSPRRR